MSKQEERNKKSEQPEKKLGMAERIPTMPDVYNRNFRILRTDSLQQVKTSLVEYIPPRPVVCPQCGHTILKLYDHYTRKAFFINHEDVRRTLIIKAKRYKYQHCSYLLRDSIEGLLLKNAPVKTSGKPSPMNT